MKQTKIGFIGAGNMAQAIIGGLLNSGTPAHNIFIFEPNEVLANKLQASLGITAIADNVQLCEQSDVIVLAVKPQIMKVVLTSLTQFKLNSDTLFISIAAGLPIKLMQSWLEAAHPMVRVMPNTPALVGAGVSGLFASKEVSSKQRQLAESVLRAVGSVIWVERESLIDTVTAVSGSGPAYFFYFIEALEKAAREGGLNADQARLLSLETAFGASKLALESEADAGTLRERVTSPGGTTQAALDVFDKNKMAEGLYEAVKAATARAKEMAASAAK